MNKYKYLLLIILLGSCDQRLSPEDYFEQCPYELKYGRSHYLEVPIEMIPHKEQYNIGDTLTVRMQFSDSIMDLSRQTKFKIENFPFEPLAQLLKIDVNKDEWQSGNRINQILVDKKYSPRFNAFSSFPDDIRGFTIYKNGYYNFVYRIVLETTGIYCTRITDQYEVTFIEDTRYEEINAIEFEGKCSDSPFYICSVIIGNPHIETYLDEIVYFDKEINRDNFARLEGRDQEHFGSGNSAIEWEGIFLFEVVE